MEKQELIEAAHCGIAWLDDYYKRKKRYNAFHRLFRKLCEKVLASDATELGFSLQDFAENDKIIESSSSEGKAFAKMSESLRSVESSLADVAVDKRFSVIPTVDMDKSGYMNVLTFGATPTPKESAIAQEDIPTGAIRYTFDEKQNLWRIFGFLAGMKLSLWPFLIVVVALLAFGAFMVWWSSLLVSHVIAYPNSGSFLLAFGTLLVVLVLWRRYRAFDRFLTTKIALVHDALARFSAPQSVAWLKNTDRKYPTIEVISASATCLICDGEIRLRKPHFECSHEVIGACRNNPTEHCFSFDSTTRLGWPITEVARRHYKT